MNVKHQHIPWCLENNNNANDDNNNYNNDEDNNIKINLPAIFMP